MSPNMSFVLTLFGASFGHSCGRFVDHVDTAVVFFIGFDVVPTLAFSLKE